MPLHNPLIFETPQELQQKMDKTLIRYKEKFVYCDYLEGGSFYLNLIKLPIPTKILSQFYARGHFLLIETQKVHSSDINLNFATPELGFLNLKHNSIYISRRSHVQYHHSLTVRSLNIKNIDGNADIRIPSIDFFHDYFYPMLSNNYGSLDRTIHQLISQNDILSQAFHKRYALKKTELNLIHVYMCSKPIGYIQPKHLNTIIIPHKMNQTSRQYKTLQSLGFHHITG